MLKRRELLTGIAASLAVPRAWANDTAGDAAAPEVLSALAGKQPLIRRASRPPNYETPLIDLRAPFTRNEAFYVRYHLAVIPEIDARSWQLRVAGASAQQPLTLSLEDLKHRFEPVTLAAVNQCSGNRRGLFSPRVPGVQWGNGAMGNAAGRAYGCATCSGGPVSRRMRSRYGSGARTAPCCPRHLTSRRVCQSSGRSMSTRSSPSP